MSQLFELSPEYWHRIRPLFHAALDRSPEEQAAFLEQACAGEPTLRRDIERLLALHLDGGGVLEQSPLGDGFAIPAPEVLGGQTGSPPTDPRLGAYRLIRRLASGGMGTVWLAQRADQHFNKQVAIKIVK